MSLLSELHTNTNQYARTANGAKSNNSTLNPVLDFFSKAGAMRGRESEAFKLFQLAYDADPQSAIRCLFYLRDIRGGQGERSVFKYILNQLDADFVNKIAQYIPEYGRWDEVPLNQFTVENMIATQLAEDMANMKESKSISLLAKWLPSENAGKASLIEARKVAKLLGWTGSSREVEVGNDTFKRVPNLRTYRKNITGLRKYYDNFLERLMSEKRWSEIDYSTLPSQAHKKHVKAFLRNDETRYRNYLASVQKGEAKINSGTLMTYELYNMVQNGENASADALWKGLPDYTNGQNALVLPDVSGSMYGLPISISVSLALYFAERNEGQFKDYFLSFSDTPKLHKVSGNTLSARMRSVQNATNWMGSTNIQAAFDAILSAAKRDNTPEREMPSTLYVISDMQFNQATYHNSETNFETIQRKYKEAGYEMPTVVFWNVNAYGNDAPATMYDNKVTLISGSNQSTFQYVVEGKTPMQSMLDVLNSERYAKIVL